jgi:uridylate kinase
MKKEIITLSIGGSLLVPDIPDVEYIKKIAKIFRKHSKKYRFAIVTGGGADARVYARAMRQIYKNEFLADQGAILSTWQNAYLLLAALQEISYKKLPSSFDEAAEALDHNDIVIMGGTIPGTTTDTVAVLLAERIDSKRVINVSNVDAIYTSDPKKDKKAKKIKTMKHIELAKLAAEKDTRKAGENFVFDVLAAKLLTRSGIEGHFVSGNKLDDLEKAITGKKHNGTIVKK